MEDDFNIKQFKKCFSLGTQLCLEVADPKLNGPFGVLYEVCDIFTKQGQVVVEVSHVGYTKAAKQFTKDWNAPIQDQGFICFFPDKQIWINMSLFGEWHYRKNPVIVELI